MLIDFNELNEITMPGMNGGSGTMKVRMYSDGMRRIILTSIHAGGSIGLHTQTSGDDMNYILAGTGKAICGGTGEELKEEALKPGVMHICPKNSQHSIINTGSNDLVMLTIVADIAES